MCIESYDNGKLVDVLSKNGGDVNFVIEKDGKRLPALNYAIQFGKLSTFHELPKAKNMITVAHSFFFAFDLAR